MRKIDLLREAHLFFIIQTFLILNSATRNLEKLGSPKKIIILLGGTVIPFRSLIIDSK